ncbi:MAG: glycosyltransferase [Muribaculum sp.]|nr:glycosyltransferase [Muribaculum sp.]
MKNLIPKIFRVIRHPKRYMNIYLLEYYKRKGNFKEISSISYRLLFNKRINWKHPEDLNQWINWLEFNSDTTKWSLYADKYRVREFVQERGFKDNLVNLIAVWDSVDEIDISNLPSKFVVKMNNGSGDVFIVKDKSKIDTNDLKNHFIPLFNNEYGRNGGEPHYDRIKPRIIVEELLDVKKQSWKSDSLIDYKFWCMNGKPYVCFVCSNRTKQHFTVDLYSADKNWERLDDKYMNHDTVHLRASESMPKPATLDTMLAMVSSLSKGEPQMRVDLYEVDGRVYFGEITMTSAAGRMDYFNDDCLRYLGDKCAQAVKDLGINKY